MGGTGFGKELNDGHIHPRHFAAFAVVGFDHRMEAAETFSWLHERPGMTGASPQDVELGYAGSAFGESIAQGWLPLGAVGQWITDGLCTPR